MSKGLEEIKERLDNIRSIEPMLAALKTISLSNWKFIIKKIDLANQYINHLASIYNKLPNGKRENISTESPENGGLIVIGSNRGLCSNFNRDLIKYLKTFLLKSSSSDQPIIIYGERLEKMLHHQKIAHQHFYSYPSSSDLNPTFIHNQIRDSMIDVKFQNLSILFNQYQGSARYQTILSKLFPLNIKETVSPDINLDDFIFDTTPQEISQFLENQLCQMTLYNAFLSSAAAEHSTRFQLMENASINADQLAEELKIEFQVLRRQKITYEMQELAIGAGLLNKTSSKK